MFSFGEIEEPKQNSKKKEKKETKEVKTEKVKKEKKSEKSQKITIDKNDSNSSQKDYNSMTIEQLKLILESRGLKKTGNKSDLIERINLSFHCESCTIWRELKDKKKCGSCKKVTCEQCLRRCHNCSTKFCLLCKTTCSCDSKNFRNECSKCHSKDNECSLCKKELCKYTTQKCYDCKKFFCEEHSIKGNLCSHFKCKNCKEKEKKCSNCSIEMCCTDILDCSSCSKKACRSCIKFCSKCKKPFCFVHLENGHCNTCNQSRNQFSQLKSDLIQVMKESFELRNFYTSSSINEIPIIKIKGEYLSLPFTSWVFDKFKDKFKKSPFGRGEKTIHDETFRKSLELDSNDVFLSQEFIAGIEYDIIPIIIEELCPENTSINFELYKMVIYEKGDFFKPHKDTQRSKEHFGTLIIFLPSIYEGGEFVISHDQVSKSYNSSIDDERVMQLQWLAFFTDCVHEIQPVISGHRAVLTFNLYFQGEQKLTIPPLSLSNSIQEKLDNFYLNPDLPNPVICCFLLSHNYTKDTLNPRYLKGKDLNLYKQLSQIKNYKIQMKLIHKEITTEYDECKNEILWEFMEEFKLPLKIDNIPIIYLNDDSFLKKDIKELTPYHKNIWETGNEGTKINLQYRLTGFYISRIKREGSIDFAQEEETPKKKVKPSEKEEEIIQDRKILDDSIDRISLNESVEESDIEDQEDLFKCINCNQIAYKQQMIDHVKEYHPGDKSNFIKVLED